MNIHYFYYLQQATGSSTPIPAVVEVRMSSALPAEEAAAEALAVAKESLASVNITAVDVRPLAILPLPVVRVVIRRGEVAACFSQFHARDLAVEVFDLDKYQDIEQEDKAAMDLQMQMQKQGYTVIPSYDGQFAEATHPQG